MTTLREAEQAWIACVEHQTGSLGRIAYWVDQLGDKALADVTEDDVDQALVVLAQRGKLKAGRGGCASPSKLGGPWPQQALTDTSQPSPAFISTRVNCVCYRALIRRPLAVLRKCLK